MKIGFIGDIIGKPGRTIIEKNLPQLKDEYSLDLVIANYENASHGFGLTEKNCKELLSYGIDIMTGGNHSFDKKEILTLFDKYPILRPLNYPKETVGKGVMEISLNGYEIAIINLMGHYTMPLVDNPFTTIVREIEILEEKGIKHIILDIHAEASAEKYVLLHLLKDRVSAIIGTHTHVSTDDLTIFNGCCFLSDIGLTGCRDVIIGMETEAPIKRSLTGVGGHLNIPKKCNTILQMATFELNSNGRCIDAKKIKIYGEEKQKIETEAWIED